MTDAAKGCLFTARPRARRNRVPGEGGPSGRIDASSGWALFALRIRVLPNGVGRLSLGRALLTLLARRIS